jgi:plasmid stabilization system protein ParE
MGLEIIIKKRFLNRLKITTKYLKDNWGKKEADAFAILVIEKIEIVAAHPKLGIDTSIKNTKSILAGKGNQNKIYYRVEKNKLIVIDMKDTRMNPKRNRFYSK